MRGSFASDVFAHDCHASVRSAIVAAGLWLVVLEVALSINFMHGPFGGAGNFADLSGAGVEYFQMVEEQDDDELFDAFYKPIAKDLGTWDMNAQTPGHRKQTIADAWGIRVFARGWR